MHTFEFPHMCKREPVIRRSGKPAAHSHRKLETGIRAVTKLRAPVWYVGVRTAWFTACSKKPIWIIKALKTLLPDTHLNHQSACAETKCLTATSWVSAFNMRLSSRLCIRKITIRTNIKPSLCTILHIYKICTHYICIYTHSIMYIWVHH